MPRNAEVIRQWTILRALEASRGATIRRLAENFGPGVGVTAPTALAPQIANDLQQAHARCGGQEP